MNGEEKNMYHCCSVTGVYISNTKSEEKILNIFLTLNYFRVLCIVNKVLCHWTVWHSYMSSLLWNAFIQFICSNKQGWITSSLAFWNLLWGEFWDNTFFCLIQIENSGKCPRSSFVFVLECRGHHWFLFKRAIFLSSMSSHIKDNQYQSYYLLSL